MKILILEPECKGMIHEQVNSEYVRRIAECSKGADVLFGAEKGQLENLKNKLSDVENLNYHEIELPKNSGDVMNYKSHYETLLHSLLDGQNYDKVLWLSAHSANMLALGGMIDQFPNTEFTITLHAVVEQLLKKYSLYQRIFRGLWYRGWMLRLAMDKLAKQKNVRFVTYSPCLNDALAGNLDYNTLDKIDFVHHPYAFMDELPRKAEGPLTIGLLGATANDNALKIFAELEEKYPNGNYKFEIIRGNAKFGNYKHAQLLHQKGFVPREEIEDVLSKVDFMLIPYDESAYRASASGVFFDAVNYGIPMFMLKSPLLQWYNDRYGLGVMCDSISDAVEKIYEMSEREFRGELAQYIGNLVKAKAEIRETNTEKFEQIVKDNVVFK